LRAARGANIVAKLLPNKGVLKDPMAIASILIAIVATFLLSRGETLSFVYGNYSMQYLGQLKGTSPSQYFGDRDINHDGLFVSYYFVAGAN
jgi:hypothetical protein